MVVVVVMLVDGGGGDVLQSGRNRKRWNENRNKTIKTQPAVADGSSFLLFRRESRMHMDMAECINMCDVECKLKTNGNLIYVVLSLTLKQNC